MFVGKYQFVFLIYLNLVFILKIWLQSDLSF